MSSPDLQSRLQTLSFELQPHFRAGFLQRDTTVFQFHFNQGDLPFYLKVHAQDFKLKEGEHKAPTIRLQVENHQLCIQLLKGEIDGMEAFMKGHYRADGHIVLSQLLLYLFRDQKQINIYEVQD